MEPSIILWAPIYHFLAFAPKYYYFYNIYSACHSRMFIYLPKVGLMQKYSLDVQWRKQPIQLVTLTIKSKRRIPENTNSLNRAISIFKTFLSINQPRFIFQSLITPNVNFLSSQSFVSLVENKKTWCLSLVCKF